jgi:uncharacterized protein
MGNKFATNIAVEFIKGIVNRRLDEEKEDLDEFQEQLDALSDEELSVFIPDVYQKSIYKIDYERLWQKGVRLLSYDIDDTISDCARNNIINKTPFLEVKMPAKAQKLVKKLKKLGFTVILITNAEIGIAKDACESLNADGYIFRANKPETDSFDKTLEKYNLDKSQMAHIGNSMRDDVAGGNKAGIITCLIRRNGKAWKVAKAAGKAVGIPTRGHLIRKKMSVKNMWHKHHVIDEGDQYYQLGERQRYSENFRLYKMQ